MRKTSRLFYFAKYAIEIEWERRRSDKLRKHYLKAWGIKKAFWNFYQSNAATIYYFFT